MERVADVPAHGARQSNRDPSDFALTNKNLVCCYVCRLIKSRNQVPPHRVMAFLNDLFTIFDQLVEKHQVYKVETIGVNVASRMESTGVPGAVHISAATRALLGAAADGFLSTGGIPVKGKGFMLTYVYDPCGVAPQRSQTVSRTGSAVPGIGREGPQVPGGEASSGTPTEAPPPLPQ
ncbi:hypothetical protein VOLCADRAFT_104602 [Volvox carteri f. nagariensis]|uniref:Guanylate cyclase domain-containing protein n=1 Tax=Volvox carteri f. nagariensis TaxID=3068 RepID=D8TUS7_VOLCA|nr:uncharacterized protein VOLCADRAFT_104602 [Volvox carteri f. nagariensis]EFJ48760.1 hypothetical protein VOLCADRAFT_104602 [Volvox carteri f. nagariensis]|eukprot:XP_002950092.1 hypothetical protein VOLCADRAFT_104602 [Volvox carteri f. nagariensis]